MRSDLQEKYPAGLAAADPVEAIRHSLRVDGRSLAAGGRSFEVDPHQVDVNVHPTKQLVRFSDEKGVRQAISEAVRNAIQR